LDWKSFYEEEAKIKHSNTNIKDVYISSLTSKIKFKNLLDVGCGDGILCKIYKNKGVNKVVGIDLSKNRIKTAILNCAECEFAIGSIYNLPFKDNSFDLVAAVEVIEHLEKPEKALNELKRVSKKYVIFQVPYNEIISEEICPHCLKKFYPRGHLQSFNEKVIKTLCDKCGLNILDIDRFFHTFDHPYIRWIPSLILKRLKKIVFNEFIKHGGYIGVLCEK